MKINILLVNLLLLMKSILAEENGLGNLVDSKTIVDPSSGECRVVNRMLKKEDSFDCCNLLNVVECENKHITKIHIEDRNITGEIPEEIGNLIYLRELWLDHNQLSGHIPKSIGNIVYLKDLSLGANELYGSIPAEIGKLTDLEKLNLYENSLSNEIPPEIGNLSNLWHLDFHNNTLRGEIPIELSKLSKLKVLNLDYNKLNISSIPQQIQNLPNLTKFYYTNQEYISEHKEKTKSYGISSKYFADHILPEIFRIGILCLLIYGIWLGYKEKKSKENNKNWQELKNKESSDRNLPGNDSIIIEYNQIEPPPNAVVQPQQPQSDINTEQLKQQIEQQEKQLQQQMQEQQQQLQQIQQMKNQLNQY